MVYMATSCIIQTLNVYSLKRHRTNVRGSPLTWFWELGCGMTTAMILEDFCISAMLLECFFWYISLMSLCLVAGYPLCLLQDTGSVPSPSAGLRYSFSGPHLYCRILSYYLWFTMDVSQIRLFLMHIEIICTATCTSLWGKSVVSFIKWTVLINICC